MLGLATISHYISLVIRLKIEYLMSPLLVSSLNRLRIHGCTWKNSVPANYKMLQFDSFPSASSKSCRKTVEQLTGRMHTSGLPNKSYFTLDLAAPPLPNKGPLKRLLITNGLPSTSSVRSVLKRRCLLYNRVVMEHYGVKT